MFGRHGEAPIPIVASYSPAQCFEAAIEAARIALKYRTPVILLSDGYLANGSEPWRIPDVESLPDISVPFQTEHNGVDAEGNPIYLPVPARPRHARPTVGDPRHARPDAPCRRAREGRQDRQRQLHAREPRPDGHLRQAKIERIADDYPELEIAGRPRRRHVHPRMGLDLGGDPRRRPTPAAQRPQAGVDPPHPPQSAPERPRRQAAALPARCSCPSSTGVSCATSCAAST